MEAVRTMERLHVKYLLIGGGIASSAAAESIRSLDKTESILLVAQEISRTYDRSPLSKGYLRRTTEKRELAAKQLGWYAEHGIQLRTGRRVAHIDVPRSCALIDNGDEVFFDSMMLATGAVPKPIGLTGGGLPNTFYLKTIADADRLHHAIEISRSAGHNRACVIGAGLLGVEVAASLAQVGMHIDLIQSQATVWPKIAGEQTGAFLGRRLKSAGVKVHDGVRAVRLEGDGRVQRVVLSDDSIVPADFVVAAVGSQLNREILRNTPIAAESAVLTDEHGRTNIENIYAAGDCAAILDRRFGKHRPATHWGHAATTGRLCGINMAGGDAAYDEVTHFTSEVAGLTVHVWGESRFVSHRLMRGNALCDEGGFAEIGIAADGRVAQIVAVDREDEHAAYERMVYDRVTIADRAEALKDPATPLP